MPAQNLTVREYFAIEGIDIDFLDDNFGGTSQYWNSAIKFINEKWFTDLKYLTDKQHGWMIRILEDAVEEKIERKARA